MTLAYRISTILSVVLFLYYGTACLFADAMKADFERFGLSRLRLLTGALEVLGAIGLLVGHFAPVLAVASAAGLAVLMALGVMTRVRVRDPWWEALPAAILMLVNGFIAWHALGIVTGVV